MTLTDRVLYTCLSGFFGALIGVVGWWLYGVGHSLNYSGPGMDPVLKHWLTFLGGGYAFAGLVWGERVADAVGGSLTAILHFEFDQSPSNHAESFVILALLVIVLAAVWFTVP